MEGEIGYGKPKYDAQTPERISLVERNFLQGHLPQDSINAQDKDHAGKTDNVWTRQEFITRRQLREKAGQGIYSYGKT